LFLNLVRKKYKENTFMTAQGSSFSPTKYWGEKKKTKKMSSGQRQSKPDKENVGQHSSHPYKWYSKRFLLAYTILYFNM